MSADKIKVAVVGAGLIGRAWVIVFARAGHAVALYDADAEALSRSLVLIDGALADLKAAGLLDEEPAVTRGRIAPVATLAEAAAGAGYVQENIAETLAAKQPLFAELDRLVAPEAIFASSTSTIPASLWSADLAGRARCLVAHPINPPHL